MGVVSLKVGVVKQKFFPLFAQRLIRTLLFKILDPPLCLGEDSKALKSLKVGYAYVLTYHKLEDYTEKIKL